MTNEEAIKIVKYSNPNSICVRTRNEKMFDKREEAFNMAIKALEQEPRWIPVSERLPEKNVEVLATTEWGEITIAEMFSNNDWFIHEGATSVDIDDIIAWMPLPKPYKAESEDKE